MWVYDSKNIKDGAIRTKFLRDKLKIRLQGYYCTILLTDSNTNT